MRCCSGTSSDRFSRILNHMLTQRRYMSSKSSFLFFLLSRWEALMSVSSWSYYPLYPPAEEVNMDYEKFQIHGQMLVTPDILVVPSELRYFVKVETFQNCFKNWTKCPLDHVFNILTSPSSSHHQDVAGCVCVNPGRLTKGQVGGTYGRLLIQRSTAPEDGKRESPCLTAQVVKIWYNKDSDCYEHVKWAEFSTSFSYQDFKSICFLVAYFYIPKMSKGLFSEMQQK